MSQLVEIAEKLKKQLETELNALGDMPATRQQLETIRSLLDALKSMGVQFVATKSEDKNDDYSAMPLIWVKAVARLLDVKAEFEKTGQLPGNDEWLDFDAPSPTMIRYAEMGPEHRRGLCLVPYCPCKPVSFSRCKLHLNVALDEKVAPVPEPEPVPAAKPKKKTPPKLPGLSVPEKIAMWRAGRKPPSEKT